MRPPARTWLIRVDRLAVPGAGVSDVEADVTRSARHRRLYEGHLGVGDSVGPKVVAHPAEMRRLGLDADEPDRPASDRAKCGYGTREPAAVARTELDHGQSVARRHTRDRLQHVDPFDVLLVHGRKGRCDMPVFCAHAAPHPGGVLVTRKHAQEIRMPAGRNHTRPALEPVEYGWSVTPGKCAPCPRSCLG